MVSSCNFHSFLPPLLLSLHSSPSLGVPLHLSSHSFFFFAPAVSARLISSLVLHPTFHSISFFFSLHQRPPHSFKLMPVPPSLFVTHHFFFTFTPSLIRVRKTCLCSFLEFHSPQNARSSLLVATRDAGATNAAISSHLNESNFLLEGIPACPYIYLPLKLSGINAN